LVFGYDQTENVGVPFILQRESINYETREIHEREFLQSKGLKEFLHPIDPSPFGESWINNVLI